MDPLFCPYTPDQQYLLPPSLRDWLPEDHLAYFISDTVDALDLGPFLGRCCSDGSGNVACHPALMCKLLLYGYATGVFSSRKIAKACETDIAFRVLAAGDAPSHRTVARFRKERATVLTQEGQFAGSLLYAAPEQIQRAEVGPSADLYALGVLLYELATGENPFRFDDLGAVVHAHLETVPAKARDRNPDLSAFLSEALATLLQKEPAKRFDSADLLRDVLRAGKASAWWREREGTLLRERARVPRVPVRRETELHGRETDLTLLRQTWDDVKNGEGKVVLLEGEAGIGKSRLVDAFLTEAAGDDLHVLYGSYPPSGGMGGLSDAVLDRFGAVDLAGALRPYLLETPTLAPAFAAVLKHEARPEGAPPLEGDALHAVFCHLMRALAEEKPLLWVIEDLHFAAADSRKIVLSLARIVEGQRILLLTTTRPGLPEAEIAHFGRLGSFRRSNLARLGARDVVLLLRDAFRNRALADKLAARIAVKSDGIPFFIFEMIRGLKEGQFLTEPPDGSYVESKVIEEIEVPSAVKDLIAVRLGDLSKGERAVLDVGAVQAFAFDPDLVARTLERARVGVLQDLAEIERRSGVVRSEGRAYHFDHHQIQEVMYAELSEGLRAEYHTLLAQAFAGRESDRRCGSVEPSGAVAYFLAFHHLRGVQPRRAPPALDAAYCHLVDAHRREEAVDMGRLALETVDLLEGRDRVELLVQMENTLSFLGRREEQRAVIEEALEAQISGHLGCSHERTGQYHEARKLHERQLALGREGGHRWNEEAALGNLGGLYHQQGENREACRYQERSLAIARETGNLRGQIVSSDSLARVHWELGNYEEARRYFEHALGLAKASGYRKMEASSHGGLGNLLYVLGHFTETSDHYDRQLALAQEMGDLTSEMGATSNLGVVQDNLGRYGEALARYQQALALARDHKAPLDEAIALVNLGDVFSHLGRQEEARTHLERALTQCRELGHRRVESYALHRLGRVAERCRSQDEARRCYEDALDLRRELDYRRGIAETLVTLGNWHASQGHEDPAIACLDEAVSLGRDLGAPEMILLASAHRALLPGGSPAAAMEAWDEHASRVAHAFRMEARFVLWRATNDPAHLDEAKRLLDHLVAHAPEEYRASMLENVPLHRDLVKAVQEPGEH